MNYNLTLEEINLRDPFIFAEDGKYFLYGTKGNKEFGKSNAFYVFVSEDLKYWSEPIEVFGASDDFWATKNFWAPEVYKYNGKYYMFASFKSDTEHRGTQILVSNSPINRFEPISDGPVTPRDWECLDGTFYVDKNGKPYMIFCHEWTQVHDGEMCIIELSEDLKKAISEPDVLFKASEPSWADKTAINHITDGPFIYETESGKLLMIWSSVVGEDYVEAISYSDNGEITGEWKHYDKLLFAKDGGHGMIFESLEKKKYFVFHYPNTPTLERPVLKEIVEKNDRVDIVQKDC